MSELSTPGSVLLKARNPSPKSVYVFEVWKKTT